MCTEGGAHLHYRPEAVVCLEACLAALLCVVKPVCPACQRDQVKVQHNGVRWSHSCPQISVQGEAGRASEGAQGPDLAAGIELMGLIDLHANTYIFSLPLSCILAACHTALQLL